MSQALPRVTVLMALYQGAAFLRPQLDSIAGQDDVDWRLIVGDDGSTDEGPAMVRDFAGRHPGRVTLRDGPRSGAAANFRALLRAAPAGDLAALSDQDDVWLPGKIDRAAKVMSSLPAERPARRARRAPSCSTSSAAT